jgi:hypothetical protein
MKGLPELQTRIPEQSSSCHTLSRRAQSCASPLVACGTIFDEKHRMLKQMSRPDNASTPRSFFHKSAAISRAIPVVRPAGKHFTGGVRRIRGIAPAQAITG